LSLVTPAYCAIHFTLPEEIKMKTFTTLVLAAGLATAFAGASFAQTKMMSDSDKAMMTKCKGMGESAMKADKDCMAMMKAHPEMMSPGSQEKTVPKSGK
jgi:hypothetical protein